MFRAPDLLREGGTIHILIDAIITFSFFFFGKSDVSNPILALGKFNALHLGHKELISRASQIGHPCLLSFSGMSKVRM